MYIDMPEPKTGMEKNLFEQLHLVMTHARQGSLETRRRYASAGFRFLRWLAGRFHTKRLANMDRKHLECYAAYLKDEELAAKTIETELSALRWIHSQVSAPTNKIRKGPGSNLALGVGHDSRMGVHREWTSDELDEMADLAAMSGRQDVAILIRLASATGLRLNEICGLRRHQAESALRGKYLRVKGKNGKVRDIPVNAEASLLLLKAVQGVKRG
ncbi:MAG: tyrosine-type recombinase/integrase [Bacillota bacterium]